MFKKDTASTKQGNTKVAPTAPDENCPSAIPATVPWLSVTDDDDDGSALSPLLDWKVLPLSLLLGESPLASRSGRSLARSPAFISSSPASAISSTVLPSTIAPSPPVPTGGKVDDTPLLPVGRVVVVVEGSGTGDTVVGADVGDFVGEAVVWTLAATVVVEASASATAVGATDGTELGASEGMLELRIDLRLPDFL